MTKCVDVAVDIAAAACAGVCRVALCGAGRSYSSCVIVMSRCRNRPCLRCAAAGAGSLLGALRSAGGRLGLLPCAVIMTECAGVSVLVALAADGAGVGGVTLCRASRGSDCHIILMAGRRQSVYFLRSANCAGIHDFSFIFATGGLRDLAVIPCMSMAVVDG